MSYGPQNTDQLLMRREQESSIMGDAFSHASEKCGGYQNWTCVCRSVKKEVGSVRHMHCGGHQQRSSGHKDELTSKDHHDRHKDSEVDPQEHKRNSKDSKDRHKDGERDRKDERKSRDHSKNDERTKEDRARKGTKAFSDFSDNLELLTDDHTPCTYLTTPQTSDGDTCSIEASRYSAFLMSGCPQNQWSAGGATSLFQFGSLDSHIESWMPFQLMVVILLIGTILCWLFSPRRQAYLKNRLSGEKATLITPNTV